MPNWRSWNAYVSLGDKFGTGGLAKICIVCRKGEKSDLPAVVLFSGGCVKLALCRNFDVTCQESGKRMSLSTGMRQSKTNVESS